LNGPGVMLSRGGDDMSDTDLNTLIRSSENGDAKAREELFTVLYAELHNLAQRQLRRNASLTLSPTTLLHETYLDMSSRGSVAFPDQARFLAYASRAMRGLIIDYARRSNFFYCFYKSLHNASPGTGI